jgi:aspartokinase
MAATLVMKFGGSLLVDARNIARVAQVILAEALAWDRMVVVVSAMTGVTNAISNAVNLAVQHNASGYRQVVAELRHQHLEIIAALFENPTQQNALTRRIDQLLFDVLTVCDRVAGSERDATPRERDLAEKDSALHRWMLKR